MPKQIRIGVALGSGGAKGFAHIGALQVLVENKIKIDVVTGSSAGAIIGGLFAAGLDPYYLENKALELKSRHIIDISLSKHGFIGGKKAEKIISDLLLKKSGVTSFEDIKNPSFGCATVDLYSGKPFYITSGNLVKALHASFAIPLVFRPVVWGDRLLIDGGPLTRVPVKLARKMGADFVIGIDCVGELTSIKPEHIDSFGETYTRFLFLSDYHTSKNEFHSADYLVSISQDDVSSVAVSKAKESILYGRRAMEKALPYIIEKIDKLKNSN